MNVWAFIAIWAASVLAAFVLGREYAPQAAPVEEAAESGRHRAEGRGAGGSSPSPHLSPSAQPDRSAREVAPSERLRQPTLETVRPTEPLDLTGASTPEELLGRLLSHLAAHLAAGPEGHRAAFKALDRALTSEGPLRELLRHDEQLEPHAYALLRFLMDRDAQVVDMFETLMRTAENEPAFYDGTDDDTFEWVAEGLGPLVPGMVSPERLERLRGHVKGALAKLSESGAGVKGREGLAKSRGDLERMLGTWTPRLGSREAAARLASGAVERGEVVALLRQVRPEDRADLDFDSLLGPLMESGHPSFWSADVLAGMDARDTALLDQRLLALLGRETTDGGSSWRVRRWLELTGRADWAQARGFLENGLARGGMAADLCALALPDLKPRPSLDAVDALFSASPPSAKVAQLVRMRLGAK